MIYYKKKSLVKKIILKFRRTRYNSDNDRGFFLNFLGGFLGAIKWLSILCVLFIAFLYSAYLFMLPKYVTDNDIERYINSYLSKNTKLVVDFENLSIHPNYKFEINLKADSIIIKTIAGKNILSLKKPSIDVSLATLFFRYIDLNKIKTDEITINTVFKKDNHYDCFDYFDLDIFNLKQNNLDFQLRNIRILADKFLFNLFDENTGKKYYIKTSRVNFSYADTKKPFSVSTRGVILAQNKKISDFNLNLKCKIPEDAFEKFKEFIQKLNYNPLVAADDFNFYSSSDIDLKIIPDTKKTDIEGVVKLSDYSFKIGSFKLPKNSIAIFFKGDKLKADCDFNLIKNQFIKLKLNAAHSKNKFIELSLNSSEIDLADLKNISDTLLKILNIKVSLDDVKIAGKTSADLYVKSDFKRIASKGSAKIYSASIQDKKTGLLLNNVNSSIDFADNKINIKDTYAYIDKAKFNILGSIDSNTNLSLKVNSDPINIAQVLELARKLPLVSVFLPKLDDYIFKSGLLKINAIVEGKLDDPLIKSNSCLSNLKVYIKSLKAEFKCAHVQIDAYPEKGIIKDIFMMASNSELNSKINSQNIKVKVPVAKLRILKDSIEISKTALSIDNIKAYFDADIKDYNKSPKISANLQANIPSNTKFFNVRNKNLNAALALDIDENRIFIQNGIIKEGAKNLINLNGSILKYTSDNPYLDNFKINIEDKLGIILADFNGLSFNTVGNLNISSNVKNPVINGVLNISDIHSKDLNADINEIILNIKNSMFNIFASGVSVYDVTLNASATADLKGNNLYLKNIQSEIFNGIVSGDALVNLNTLETNADIILNKIHVRNLNPYLKQYSIAASGKLSALIKVKFDAKDLNNILKDIDGYAKFNIDDGELAQFAKLERFLQAGNILSQNILKLKINSVISTITKQNTGDFKTIEGTVKLKNGLADIQYIKTIGSSMSMYITGSANLLNQNVKARVLGRIPSSVARGAQDIAISKNEESITKNIPQLADYRGNTPTREFIVIIDGPPQNVSSVKMFRWLSDDE